MYWWLYIFFHRLDGHHRQPSLTSELKLPPESDNESIADYADGMGDG